MRSRFATLLLVVAVACGSTTAQKKKTEAEESSRVDVSIVAREVMNDVQRVSRKLNSLSRDRELRRTTLTWQINSAEYTLRALQRPDPRLAFIDLWTLLLQTRAIVATERGKELLGTLQGVALEELDGMVARIESRAREFLPKQFATLKAALDEYVNARTTDADEIARPPTAGAGRDSIVSVMLSVPDGIFSLGGGVKDTAASIGEVARATEQGVGVMGAMPQMIRWQTQLLLLDVEENESVVRVLAALEQAGKGIEQVGTAAEQLPQSVETAGTRLLADAEKSMPEFRQTMAEGRRVVEEARGALKDVDPLLDKVRENGAWVDTASGKITEAGTAWTGAFEQLNLLVNPPPDPRLPPPEPTPPFDFKDVVTTAERASETAHSLRESVADLREVIEGKAPARLESAAGSAIGRVTTSGVILIVTFFAALLAYRVLAARFARAA